VQINSSCTFTCFESTLQRLDFFPHHAVGVSEVSHPTDRIKMIDKIIGASIGYGGVSPSINLASIANLLKKSIVQSEQGAKLLIRTDH
jgi:hypothetical protein